MRIKILTDPEQRGRGRPPLSDAKRKDVTVRFRVSEAEKETLQGAAQSAGQSLSEWLRTMALRAATRKS